MRQPNPGGHGPASTLACIDILLLCTGNVCRSPMAEALLRHRFAQLGVDAHVHSAGLLLEGEPASALGVEVLGTMGLDLSSHRSRQMTAEMLEPADLIIGMARQHVREAVLLRADVWSRSFTLKELVRRGAAVGPRQPGEPVSSWLERLHQGRTHTELVGESSADDVADPMGKSRDVYERTVSELEYLVDQLVGLMVGRVAA